MSARGTTRQSPQISSFKFQKSLHIIHAMPKNNCNLHDDKQYWYLGQTNYVIHLLFSSSKALCVPLTVTQRLVYVPLLRERYTEGRVLPSLDFTVPYCSHSSANILSKTLSPAPLHYPSTAKPLLGLIQVSAFFVPEPPARHSCRENSPGLTGFPLHFWSWISRGRLSSALQSYCALPGVLFSSSLRECFLSSSPSSNFPYTSLTHPILPFSWWSCLFIFFAMMSYEVRKFLISVKCNLSIFFFDGVCFWCRIYKIFA